MHPLATRKHKLAVWNHACSKRCVARLHAAAGKIALATYKLSPLPDLAEAPSASAHIQMRLNRLWDLLQLPLPCRLDSVLAFTSKDRACTFEHALTVSLHLSRKQQCWCSCRFSMADRPLAG